MARRSRRRARLRQLRDDEAQGQVGTARLTTHARALIRDAIALQPTGQPGHHAVVRGPNPWGLRLGALAAQGSAELTGLLNDVARTGDVKGFWFVDSSLLPDADLA